MMQAHNFKDITGLRFGRLKVLSRHPENNEYRQAQWNCICDCGQATVVLGYLLRNNVTTSCGCFSSESTTERNRYATKHGHNRKGRATRTYHSWQAMKERCINPNATGYESYGGRGITVCDRWLHSFENFLADMGERPRGKTLDRIDNDGNYAPRNCQWATPKQQQRNRRPPSLWAVRKKPSRTQVLAVAA